MNRSLFVTARCLSFLVAAALPACRGGAAAKGPTDVVAPAAAQPAHAAPPDAKGDDDVSVEDFYEPLAAYGAWVDVAPYGRVWQPSSETVGQDFMPYGTDGRWAVNDDGDWVFEGKHDETFGWAAYHYGRWLQHDEYGWVWVPGTKWAPAWVAWRFGGGYVGWAPAGPDGAGTPQEHWVVVEERRFVDEGAIRARLDPEKLPAALSAAPALTGTRGAAGWNGGPPPEHFRAMGQTPSVARTKTPAKGETRARAKLLAQASTCKAPVHRQARKKARKAKGKRRKTGRAGGYGGSPPIVTAENSAPAGT